MPIATVGYAAFDNSGFLKPYRFELPDLKDEDVHIKVKYCGICHSDLHQAKNDWCASLYPTVLGHEVIGIVEAVGPKVTKVKPGDKVGVGLCYGSCNNCDYCNIGEEQFCQDKVTIFNDCYRHARGQNKIYGGFARDVCVTERFAFKIPDCMDLAKAAPLLCAGVTTYSPMKIWNMLRPGVTVGVMGLGGLGHLAVKFGVAAGSRVIIIGLKPSEKANVLAHFGAHEYIVSTDEAQMMAYEKSFDFIINTVSGVKDFDPLLSMLKTGGTLVTLALPPVTQKSFFSPCSLIFERRNLVGGLIGGSAHIQEMFNFCCEKNISADIEIVAMQDINTAIDRMVKGIVKYRFVLDIENTCPKLEDVSI